MKARGETSYYLMMTMTALFWSGAFITGKIGIQEIPPFSLTFLRFLFAAIVMLPVIFSLGREICRIRKRDFLIILVLGIVGMFGYHVLFFTSLKYTTAINDSIICAASPLITSLLASLFLGEYFGVKRVKAVVLTLCGVLLAITNGDIHVIKNIQFNIGDVIMIFAVLCQASFSVISRTLKGRVSPIAVIYFSFLVGIVALIPFVFKENPQSFISNITWKGWTSVIYMAVFASAIGSLFQVVSINSIGASKTMIFLNLVPVFSLVFSSIVLGEEVTVFKIASILVIITGVYQNSIIKQQI